MMIDVLFIIAPTKFKDSELFDTKQVVEKAGLTTEIASKTVGIKKGSGGKTAKANVALGDVNIKNYRAIVFIGGPGTLVYFDDAAALSIAKKTLKSDKILAAICISPVILANAGILKGKKATVWDDPLHAHSRKLKAKGAKYTGEDVEKDHNLITAEGPSSAKKFGKAIVDALKK